jgi:hypothetical protein
MLVLRWLVLAFFTLSLAGCIEIRQQQIEVTPGTVPPEIRGATWPDLPIAYCIVRDPLGGFVDHDRFVALTQQAFAAWGVPTTYEGECDGPLAHNNDRNEIGWGDLESNPDDLTEAGNTNLRYRSTLLGGTPDITEADVTIHRVPASGKDTEACLYTTLLHETGHVIGLPHLGADTLMSPVITDCIAAPTPADLAERDELY